MNKELLNKIEFDVLYDVKNGNPNGDPDADNLPRIDAVSGKGYVTDACLKRKIRNFVNTFLNKEDSHGYDIFVREDSFLNENIDKMIDLTGCRDSFEALKGKKKGKGAEKESLNAIVKKARELACENYYDVRAFGAVMSTGSNIGRVTGPVQVTMAESIDEVMPQNISITRCCRVEDDADINGTIGKKTFIPYGLYRFHVYVSAPLARKTGFSEGDLEVLKQSLLNMFENDHTAARGEVHLRKLIMYRHESEFGNCPSAELFDKLQIAKKQGCDLPTKFEDYTISFDNSEVLGVSITELY